jgi:hypothetical protein
MPCSWMRHANSNITMNIYTHAISSKKRRAQSKAVGNDSASGKSDTSFGGRHLVCILLCIAPIFQKRAKSLLKNGGDDERLEIFDRTFIRRVCSSDSLYVIWTMVALSPTQMACYAQQPKV